MVEDADYETELCYTSYIELITLKWNFLALPLCKVVDTIFGIWPQELLSPQKILPLIHHVGPAGLGGKKSWKQAHDDMVEVTKHKNATLTHMPPINIKTYMQGYTTLHIY